MITTVVVTYLAAEAAFSLVGLRYVPLRLQGDLPEDIRVFAQSSKRGVVPRDPIVLLGDSFAQGYGDWLLEADPDRNGPFHSAHVIQALTGHDVVTLGRSGAGSAEGMAALPAAAYGRTQHAWFLRLPPPHVAVVYFYEGNDLDNNMAFLARRVERPEEADLVDRVDRTLAAYPSSSADGSAWQHFALLRFSGRLVQRLYAERSSAGATRRAQSEEPAGAEAGDPPNVVDVAGRAVQVPANLQSPAMDLSREELNRATVVFERSLAYLRKLFPGTPVLVAYLTSPLSSYRLHGAEVSIQRYAAQGATRYPRERVAEYSNAVCGLIRAATVAQASGFLDLRAAVRAASAHHMLHGPGDFKHFNRKGMEMLGQTVAARIDRPAMQDACSVIEN